ncbi:hypothetical protein D918_06822 [Trichuris suis]|nr:hypothetical protein D918_06822 [Trichuris suis]
MQSDCDVEYTSTLHLACKRTLIKFSLRNVTALGTSAEEHSVYYLVLEFTLLFPIHLLPACRVKDDDSKAFSLPMRSSTRSALFFGINNLANQSFLETKLRSPAAESRDARRVAVPGYVLFCEEFSRMLILLLSVHILRLRAVCIKHL